MPCVACICVGPKLSAHFRDESLRESARELVRRVLCVRLKALTRRAIRRCASILARFSRPSAPTTRVCRSS
jgi:hypothetical protein